jgi:hypothetical protein
MLGVILLSVNILRSLMLSAISQWVVMPSVTKLSVIMPSVLVPIDLIFNTETEMDYFQHRISLIPARARGFIYSFHGLYYKTFYGCNLVSAAVS